MRELDAFHGWRYTSHVDNSDQYFEALREAQDKYGHQNDWASVYYIMGLRDALHGRRQRKNFATDILVYHKAYARGFEDGDNRV